MAKKLGFGMAKLPMPKKGGFGAAPLPIPKNVPAVPRPSLQQGGGLDAAARRAAMVAGGKAMRERAFPPVKPVPASIQPVKPMKPKKVPAKGFGAAMKPKKTWGGGY